MKTNVLVAWIYYHDLVFVGVYYYGSVIRVRRMRDYKLVNWYERRM